MPCLVVTWHTITSTFYHLSSLVPLFSSRESTILYELHSLKILDKGFSSSLSSAITFFKQKYAKKNSTVLNRRPTLPALIELNELIELCLLIACMHATKDERACLPTKNKEERDEKKKKYKSTKSLHTTEEEEENELNRHFFVSS